MNRFVKAVICDNNKYLVAEIGCGQYTGLWEFIGGPLEKDETPESALQKYAKDLLGLEIKVGDLLTSEKIEFFYDSIEFYMCELISGTITLKSLTPSNAKWIEKDEFSTLFWESINRKAVNLLLKHS